MTVEIVNVDKGGSFIGDLYMGNKKESIGLELLREGVVFINETSIDFCRQAELMEEAVESAKQNKNGYCKNYLEVKKVGMDDENHY